MQMTTQMVAILLVQPLKTACLSVRLLAQSERQEISAVRESGIAGDVNSLTAWMPGG